MLAKHPKLLMTILLFLGGGVGLLFGCGLALFVGKALPIEKNTTALTPLPNPAVRIVTVTIRPDNKDELFARLQKFADKWGYAVLIAPNYSNGSEYIVKLYRIDMKMTGSYFADSGILKLGFYNTTPRDRNPQSFFDNELDDLKNLISEIPSSTYSAEK